MAVAGVVGDADDDAEAAVGRNGNGSGPKISDKERETLVALAVEVGANLPQFLAYMKVKELGELPASDFSRAVAALNKKKAG